MFVVETHNVSFDLLLIPQMDDQSQDTTEQEDTDLSESEGEGEIEDADTDTSEEEDGGQTSESDESESDESESSEKEEQEKEQKTEEEEEEPDLDFDKALDVEPDPKKQEQQQRSREGIIDRHVEEVLNGTSIDDIPDFCRKEVLKKSQQIIDESDPAQIEQAEIRKELRTLRVSQDKQQSIELLEKTLNENEVSKKEFKEKHWDKYVNEVQFLVSHGLSRVQATQRALKQFGLSSKREIAEAEKRGAKGKSLTLPKQGLGKKKTPVTDLVENPDDLKGLSDDEILAFGDEMEKQGV